MASAPSLFAKHLGIARGLARDYYIPGSDKEDVRQEAMIALWEAARTYDPDKGTFPAFARLVVRRRLADAVKMARRDKHKMLNESQRDLDAPVERDLDASIDLRDRLKTLSDREKGAIRDDLEGTARPYDRRQEYALRRARAKLRAT